MTKPSREALKQAVFSHSRFLSNEILNHPDWLDNMEPLGDVVSVERYAELLERFCPGGLAQFRRRQILRTLLRDVLGLGTLSEITEELSNLADAILEVSYRRIRRELIARHGVPRYKDAAGESRECGMSVIALGKLGGRELNYSSDIDLMFVYAGGGETDGTTSLSNKEFYKKVANQYTQALSVCYRVDLRLRPDGSLGEVCISGGGAKRYYETRARDWELQMLIKARVAAGEMEPGLTLLDAVEPLIYSETPPDFSKIEPTLKQRRSGRAELDIKRAPGGIRDIEFLAQCLQRLHGGHVPWVRHGGTMLALARLHDKDLLYEADYGRLVSAYTFLRNLEHRLQFEDDRQTHTLPSEPEALKSLARKMPGAPVSLPQDLNEHLESVQEIYARVIHSRRQAFIELPVSAAAIPPSRKACERFMERMPPISRAAVAHTLDIFEHSPYLSEELIRTPEWIKDVVLMGQTEVGEVEGKDAGELRRYFRRQMFRNLISSLCLRVPVFETLARISDLADRAIAEAYRMAIAQIAPNYAPRMMIVALGRLGMREFDLASDADLLFIIPDEDQTEQVVWTRVANRMIEVISAYTGAGVMFAVDTRLRANGSAGALVQCESSYKEYFAKHAEAWEGIAYMKARAVAGDLERTTHFLNALQEIDWRRYGQSGRSKQELRQMRMRIEREQGRQNPLKAGLGGFYDIDFAMLYLRLKSAGIFFKVLNMPERIDIIEKMGHLDRAEAEFLRDAVTLFRAVDHGIRIQSGHASGSLPKSEQGLSMLTEIVRRWTPEHLNRQPLEEQLEDMQHRTRELFERLFG